MIELLVAIAIIGLLAAVVLVMLNSTRANARDARRLEDLKSVVAALELYEDRYQAYPNDGPDAATPALRWNAFMTQLQNAGLLGRRAIDPTNNPPYQYDYAESPAYTAGGECLPSAGSVAWLLAAQLENTNGAALVIDSDCAFTGAAPDCTDPVFCLTQGR